MLLDPETRDRLLNEWRRIQTDSQRLQRFRRHAMDIIVDGIDSAFGMDEEFAALDDAERHDYLAYVADDLAAALVRYVGFWVLNDFPRVVDWQARTHNPIAAPGRAVPADIGYRVVCADGPAEGWGYVALVPPDPLIALAPLPGSHSPWTRVIAGAPDPWPGQVVYERDGLPEGGSSTDGDGDVVVLYRFVP